MTSAGKQGEGSPRVRGARRPPLHTHTRQGRSELRPSTCTAFQLPLQALRALLSPLLLASPRHLCQQPPPTRALHAPRRGPPRPGCFSGVYTHLTHCPKFPPLPGWYGGERKGTDPRPNQRGCNVGSFRRLPLRLLSGLLVKIVNIRPV